MVPCQRLALPVRGQLPAVCLYGHLRAGSDTAKLQEEVWGGVSASLLSTQRKYPPQRGQERLSLPGWRVLGLRLGCLLAVVRGEGDVAHAALPAGWIPETGNALAGRCGRPEEMAPA